MRVSVCNEAVLAYVSSGLGPFASVSWKLWLRACNRQSCKCEATSACEDVLGVQGQATQSCSACSGTLLPRHNQQKTPNGIHAIMNHTGSM